MNSTFIRKLWWDNISQVKRDYFLGGQSCIFFFGNSSQFITWRPLNFTAMDESECFFHVRNGGTFAVRHCDEPSDLIIDVVGAGRRFWSRLFLPPSVHMCLLIWVWWQRRMKYSDVILWEMQKHPRRLLHGEVNIKKTMQKKKQHFCFSDWNSQRAAWKGMWCLFCVLGNK